MMGDDRREKGLTDDDLEGRVSVGCVDEYKQMGTHLACVPEPSRICGVERGGHGG